MSVTPSHDDGFREIHLSGKQLFFLFMAVTVVLVVTFLTGVLVGRGVRSERTEIAQAETAPDTAPVPDRVPASTVDSSAGDPRSAAPPAAVDEEPADAKAGKKTVPLPEEPQPAINRQTPPPAPAVTSAPRLDAPAKAPAAGIKLAAKPDAPVASAPATALPDADAAHNGYAVQVAAVTSRAEADTIVKRLTGKGYAAYVEVPKGSTATFRVRVGTFKTRRDAQVVADKLKKDEKFKPWVTR